MTYFTGPKHILVITYLMIRLEADFFIDWMINAFYTSVNMVVDFYD